MTGDAGDLEEPANISSASPTAEKTEMEFFVEQCSIRAWHRVKRKLTTEWEENNVKVNDLLRLFQQHQESSRHVLLIAQSSLELAELFFPNACGTCAPDFFLCC